MKKGAVVEVPASRDTEVLNPEIDLHTHKPSENAAAAILRWLAARGR